MLATKAGYAHQDLNLRSLPSDCLVQAAPYWNWVGAFFNRTYRVHCDLLHVYNNEPQFASSVNWCSVERTSFDKGWAPTNSHFEGLRDFCGGLVIVFPNTTLVEVDFSVIGWEKNNYGHKFNGLLPQRYHIALVENMVKKNRGCLFIAVLLTTMTCIR